MDLETIRGRLALDLSDSEGVVWSAEELTRAIRRALADYSVVHPCRRIMDLELAEEGRQIDLSAVAELAGVERVWYPYEETRSPAWQPFEVWPGRQLYLAGEPIPQAGETLRLFYWMAHTLAGLDGAETTTLPPADEELLVLGAAGYAALEKSRGAIGSINISGYTPGHWRRWAEGRLNAFRAHLALAAGRYTLELTGPFAPAR